jgi:hypothetical protein
VLETLDGASARFVVELRSVDQIVHPALALLEYTRLCHIETIRLAHSQNLGLDIFSPAEVHLWKQGGGAASNMEHQYCSQAAGNNTASSKQHMRQVSGTPVTPIILPQVP